jgi:hypothetical protein
MAYKYLFLKAWLKAPINGHESIDSQKIVCFKSLYWIPQGSIIGPMICNIILDGLESSLYKICLENSHYQLNNEQQKIEEQKLESKIW